MAALTVLSDFELLALFKEGRRDAYEEIYHRYWAILYRHARKLLKNDEEAKDLIQDVFFIFWTEGPDLILRTSLSAYLYSILRFKVCNWIDRQKVKSVYLSSLQSFIDKNEFSSDFRVREQLMKAVIEREVASLPSKMREVFELSRKANLSYREISEKLNISDNTVKKQINNALRILRSKLRAAIFSFFFF